MIPTHFVDSMSKTLSGWLEGEGMSQVTKCDNCGAERLPDEETGWYSLETTTADGRTGYVLGDFCSAACVAEAAKNDENDRRRFEALSAEEQEKELAS